MLLTCSPVSDVLFTWTGQQMNLRNAQMQRVNILTTRHGDGIPCTVYRPLIDKGLLGSCPRQDGEEDKA